MAEGGPATAGRLRPDSIAMTGLLTALVAFGAISNNMYLPSFPAMARLLEVPVSAVLLTLAAFFVGFAAGQLLYGSVADRYGRRPVLLAGLGAYTAASAVCAMAPDIETLIGARFVQGLAAASTQVLARAIVRDIYPPDRAARMLSIMAAVFTLAPALAPVLGGFLQSWFGWRAVFATQTAIGVGVWAVAWWGLGETLRRRDPEALDPARMIHNYRELCASRAFAGYALAFAFIFAGMFAFHSASSFVFIDLYGFGPEMYGVFFMTVASGYFLGSLVSARVTMAIGYHRCVALGNAVAILGAAAMVALAFAGVRGWAAVVAPQFVFMFGTALIMPNAIAGAMAPFPRIAGAASALFGFLQQVTGALMIAAVGWAADGTELPMMAGILAGALLSAAAYFGLARPAAGGRPPARRATP